MIVEVSPFQKLFALSENFEKRLDDAHKDIHKIFIRSIETPSEAFVICPSRVSRFFHQLWGSVRKFFGWDRICQYDQRANVQIIQSLFKEALKDLPNHTPHENKQVINFALSCDGLLGTDEGKKIFANYILGDEKKIPSETSKKNAIDVFYSCLQALPKTMKPDEALKRLCVLAPALKPDPKKISGAIDQLFASKIQKEEKPIVAWVEGQQLLHKAGILLPEGSHSCDVILSRPVDELTEPVLSSLFLEKLSSHQLQKATELADAFYSVKITSLDSILPTWEKICSLGKLHLPKTSAAIVNQLSTSTQIPLSDRYKIFLAVQDGIPEEEQIKLSQAWVEQVDRAYPLQALKSLFDQIGGRSSTLHLHPKTVKNLCEEYKLWLHKQCHTLSTKKLLDMAQGIAIFFEYQDLIIRDIADVCPDTIREAFVRQLKEISITEIDTLLLKLSQDLKITKKSYEAALHSHHVLTAIKGDLLRIHNLPEAGRCLKKLDDLLKELDKYLEEKNPNVHVAKGGRV
jgi:hypothetical protein